MLVVDLDFYAFLSVTVTILLEFAKNRLFKNTDVKNLDVLFNFPPITKEKIVQLNVGLY